MSAASCSQRGLWDSNLTVDIREKEIMNQTVPKVPAWADTHTTSPTGEYDVDEATRWEGEAFAGEIETPPRPGENRPSIMRVETETIDDAPTDIVLDLSSVPSDSEDTYRLTLYGLTQLIDHLKNGHRECLEDAVRGMEATS